MSERASEQVGWLGVDRLVGWLDLWLVGWLIRRSVGCLIRWSVRRSVGQLPSQPLQ